MRIGQEGQDWGRSVTLKIDEKGPIQGGDTEEKVASGTVLFKVPSDLQLGPDFS